MVSACLEMNSAGEVAAHLLNPFLVLTGTTGPGQGNRPTCDTLYRDWPTRQGNTATVAFQPSHWFDTAITLRWLRWLCEKFPANTRIGLVWDHAPAHDSVAVREFISDNSSWLVVALIPEGMTSILQVCDIAANASLKRFIRAWYAKWRGKELTKIRAAQPTAEKITLKIPRDAFIKGVEGIFAEFNRAQLRNPGLLRAFTQLGQNIFDPAECEVEFGKHANKLRDLQIYGDKDASERLSEALNENQKPAYVNDEYDECRGFETEDLLD